ncbi:hypothetical protein A3J78_02490 [Candidatus Beckwithbacteria bacterium RBG_13_35_6]|uniref:EamA domain-containing protein n=1 Tax=Candidatus Beckwithbacteria bacterium RBG_13_35_6 TaxID=1797456 RepID=A0A1F5DGJ3_9BACT|nr:MAG: hypothetical protein A3J78_02490 [Candidatus Beckwithbacteria bacterium RBG_13_35_6]
MPNKNKINLGILALLGAAASWGTMGVLVRFLNREITLFSQILFRFIAAFLLSSIPFLLKKRKFKLASKKDYFVILIIGVFGYALSTVFYTLAMLNTTISAGTFIFSMYILTTPILAFLLLKERVNPRLGKALIIALIGAVFIFNPTGLLINFKGNFYALIGSLLFAVYLIGSRYLNQKNSPEVVTLYSILLGVMVMLPIAIIFEKPLSLSISLYSWIFVFLFALANFSAFYLANIGFSKVKASTGSMILMMENVFATLFALVIFLEMPSITTFLGAILIISSVVYLNLGKIDKI